jgi:hypothetical protein
MNEMSHSLDPFKMQEASVGLAVFHGAAQQRQRETTSKSRTQSKSLTGVTLEFSRTNRCEERVWCLLALSASVLLALSLWV